MTTTFAYKAISSSGKSSNGVLTAESRSAAMATLAGQGLHPVEVTEQRGGARVAAVVSPSARKGKVSQKSVESFTRELANLLAGGVSLARALSLLKREASHPAAKFLWGQIHDDVVGGMSLADALAKWPKTFSAVYVAMIRAGEAGGFLDVVLSQIADFRAREADLKGKVTAALVYPCVLAFLAVGVLTFLMVSFIPTFSALFAESHGTLPLLTRIIIATSNLMLHYGLFVLIAVGILGYMAKRALATPAGRRNWEASLLATPLLGHVIGHFSLVRFCRMLGTLVGAGVPLVSSLRTAKEAIGNQILSDTVNKAIEEVQRGAALSKSLALSPKLFPPSVVEMVAVAEETGRLDKELIRLSVTYELEMDRQLRMLVAVLEPAMLFLMASIIGSVVIGMLLPIFKMSELMK